MNQKQSDRVSFSFGMKLTLPVKYESADFHVSLTSDVNEGETSKQAVERIKQEVLGYAREAYKSIRESEDGLEQQPDTRDVQPPAVIEEKKEVKPVEVKPPNIKALKQQIKLAFGVLEVQKKITPAEFAIGYLSADKEKVAKSTNLGGAINKKVDELNDEQTVNVFNNIKTSFKELGL